MINDPSQTNSQDVSVNPQTGEVYYVREWRSMLCPELNLDGQHGQNALLDCENILTQPNEISARDLDLIRYIVRARIKHRSNVAGQLSLMLSDVQFSRFIVICRRWKLLNKTTN